MVPTLPQGDPKNIQIARHFPDDVVVLGVHDPRRGANRMAEMAKQMGINYPLAVARDAGVVRAWRVQFWPTYVVLDRAGDVAAAGLKPDYVPQAVRQLVNQKPEPKSDSSQGAAATSTSSCDVPPQFLEGDARKRRRLEGLLARDTAPSFQGTMWMNAEPMQLEDLRGKVVPAGLLGDLVRSVPAERAEDERHPAEVRRRSRHHRRVPPEPGQPDGRDGPQALDRVPGLRRRHGEIIESYMVDSYPDYYLINREGQLCVADCSSGAVEEAIKLLLK